MKRLVIVMVCVVSGLLSLAGCGQAGTGVSNPPDSTTSVASAVAAVFGTSDSSSGKIVWRSTKASKENCASVDPGCTCDEVLGGTVSKGHDITTAAFADPGLYGSAQSGLQLAEKYFCALPSSPTTLNTSSSGPDGKGLFAKFTINSDVAATCTDASGQQSTFAMKGGSTGAWRNTRAADTGVAHEPEIYGRMILGGGGSSTTVNCTIFLGEGEKILSANCSDTNGQAITVDATITCKVN